MLSAEIKQIIERHASALGFDAIGFTSFQSISAGDKALEQWVAGGRHGTMQYLADIKKRRERLLVAIPDAKSIIVLGVNYFTPHPGHLPEGGGDMMLDKKSSLSPFGERGRVRGEFNGRVARYAWGRDYHLVIREMHEKLLQHIEKDILGRGAIYGAREGAMNRAPTFKSCVDTQPLPEKLLASQAGLGFLGKHTVLLNPKFGPWFFLSEIVTNLEIEIDKPFEGSCGTCSRCQDICPTGALGKDYQIDARKCIAYLTIEHKGVIPRELRPKIKDWIFGCDECLTACPFTANAIRSTSSELAPEAGHGEFLDIPELFEITSNSQYKKKFGGSAISRASRKQLLRNACIVLGNSGREEAIPYLEKALQDPSPLVRLHAAWAIGRSSGSRAKEILEKRLEGEEDPLVREEIQQALNPIAIISENKNVFSANQPSPAP